MSPLGEPRRSARAVLLIGLLIGWSSGCAASDRPSAAEWAGEWEPVVEAVPAPSEAEDLDPDRCERLLVAAREARPELERAPTEALDQPVMRWFDLAEEVGFECEDTMDLEEVLVELDDLEDRIDAGLSPGRGD